MIRAVIFDFNGVLLDDEEVHFELFREVLGQEGIAMSARQYHERFLGLDDRGCFEAALVDLRPEHCLVVEDSLAGVASAKGAGMWAVGITHTYAADGLREAGADAIIDGLKTLTPDWIARRFAAVRV